MASTLTSRRASGILAHITSLPSPFGIGDLGPASYDFLGYLKACGQTYWQFLPTGPTNSVFDHSPYMSTSAFAGSPLLISPEILFQEQLISEASLHDHQEFSRYQTEFDAVSEYKSRILQEAARHFTGFDSPPFLDFAGSNPWLDDYALFMVLKERFNNAGWFDWPEDLANRNPAALDIQRRKNRRRFDYYRFEQFEFFRQWGLLKKMAEQAGIKLFGDIPIYVGLDSVDVWTHQAIFTLDPGTARPTHVAGVPPDYFSETGQRWGNPLYRWDSPEQEIQEQLLEWWISRISAIFTLVDTARIDHFRGFESYWSIPAENETAVDGEWLPGPGKAFFDKIFARLGKLEIVAEDLGIITPEVGQLRDDLGFPGMRVLQFAFDGNPDNSFLPHNFDTPHCVVYTGTHDNDTTLGWFLSGQLSDEQRQRAKRQANRWLHDGSPIHEDLIYLALSSIGRLTIFPLQDILGFGSDCRMNTPGMPTGNWRWRCAPEFLTQSVASNLQEITLRFGRGRLEQPLPADPLEIEEPETSGSI
jgi:4-alpha-glucanotransferase